MNDFSIQLQAIKEALAKRISGVVFWFRSHAKTNGKEVTESEFNKAIEDLKIPGVTANDRKKMF